MILVRRIAAAAAFVNFTTCVFGTLSHDIAMTIVAFILAVFCSWVWMWLSEADDL